MLTELLLHRYYAPPSISYIINLSRSLNWYTLCVLELINIPNKKEIKSISEE